MNEDSSDTVLNMIGGDSENLLAKWGEPSRIEPSAYGYEWWVYNQDLAQYVQFGVAERKIVTAYVAGEQVKVPPYYINEKYEDVYKKNPLSHEISLKEERIVINLSYLILK